MLNIALFGPPGAGKGTQAAFLIERYKLFYLSTGELLRKEIAADSPLGREARDIIAGGGLASDEIIVQIIEKNITEHPEANGYLFDGFPRTALQSYILEGLMSKLHTSLTCLISITLPPDLAVSRLLKRGKTSGRTDDNETVIRNRLREYEEKTLAVLNFYRERGITHEVDGSRNIEEVAEEIDAHIREELRKRPLIVVLFGPPGSGRGSQGKALARHFGLEYIATGELVEAEIRSGSPLGRSVAELYEAGHLVPDEIVIPMLEKRLATAHGARGFIFKGIPRTLVQSYILDGLLKKHGTTTITIIDLQVPEGELIRRLEARAATDRSMPYDTTRIKIVRRLQEHQRYTVPVIRKYNQFHSVTAVDGTGAYEEVFRRLAGEVEKGLFRLR